MLYIIAIKIAIYIFSFSSIYRSDRNYITIVILTHKYFSGQFFHILHAGNLAKCNSCLEKYVCNEGIMNFLTNQPTFFFS